MSRLCTICARGGSKGVKNKNLHPMLGKPLIAHSIRQARDSGLFSVIAVSSDSDEILGVAAEHGVDFCIKRPLHLADDGAGKVPAIVHCVEQVEAAMQMRFGVVVDLDATSPLRIPDDIVGAVELLESSGAPNVITGSPARRSPYFNMVERGADGTVGLAKPLDPPIRRRQDSPACFDMNASVYVWRREMLDNDADIFYSGTRLYEMPDNRSMDIDSELDFELVEFLMERNRADG